MADFPSFEKNVQRPTQPIEVTAPDFDPDDDRSADERWLDQQWRDVASNGTAELHPLSLNRDSDKVTGDPYTTAE